MNKNYKFNEERNCYEFCDGKDCDPQDQLKHGDLPHKLCSECIGQFEGTMPDNNELSSTSKIRKARKTSDMISARNTPEITNTIMRNVLTFHST